MRFFAHFLTTFLISLLSVPPLWAQPRWEKLHGLFGDMPRKLMSAAAERDLFLTAEETAYLHRHEAWQKIFNLPKSGSVHSIQSGEGGRLFALTTEGLFESKDRGKTWQISFTALGEEDKNTLCLASDPDDPEVLYLGTGRGFLFSPDAGQNWFKSGALASEKIQALGPHAGGQRLFAVTENDFLVSEDGGRSFQRTFHVPENSGDEFDSESDETAAERTSGTFSAGISSVKAQAPVPDRIFLGTARGVFTSPDAGNTWTSLPSNGLGKTAVKDLALSKNGRLFAATASGIYELIDGQTRWKEIYTGLSNLSAQSLAVVSGGQAEETLYAIAGGDIFKFEIELPPPASKEFPGPVPSEELKALLAREPTAGEVQRAAIRYADVANGKIKRWHLASRLKALVPDLSLGRDISVHNNVDIDRASTNQADLFILGPDSHSKGKDISLDWELSDLIWGPDQTSIDSREKLMVELRNDLVNEVTRLYFERRRLVLELCLNPPPAEKDYLELVLRIDELTSYLDGITGGYLSLELQKRQINYPGP